MTKITADSRAQIKTELPEGHRLAEIAGHRGLIAENISEDPACLAAYTHEFYPDDIAAVFYFVNLADLEDVPE